MNDLNLALLGWALASFSALIVQAVFYPRAEAFGRRRARWEQDVTELERHLGDLDASLARFLAAFKAQRVAGDSLVIDKSGAAIGNHRYLARQQLWASRKQLNNHMDQLHALIARVRSIRPRAPLMVEVHLLQLEIMEAYLRKDAFVGAEPDNEVPSDVTPALDRFITATGSLKRIVRRFGLNLKPPQRRIVKTSYERVHRYLFSPVECSHKYPARINPYAAPGQVIHCCDWGREYGTPES